MRGSCPTCGLDPAPERSAVAAPAGDPARIRRRVKKPSHHARPRRRSREGRRKARALMIFVVVWIALVAFTAVFVKKQASVEPTPAPAYVEKSEGPTEEEARLLSDNLSDCAKHLQEFLAAPDAAARSRHVLRPDRTIPRMARHYSDNPPVVGNSKLSLRLQHVLHTPAGPAIETTWTVGEEERIEAVFFKEGEDWKIDWDAFARYNSEPWPLFLSAQGPGEGVFRVLARERIGANGKDDEFISLVLGVPRPGHPDEATSPSPEIKVKRASAIGQRIQEAFDAKAGGTGAFGSRAVTEDPDGMIRLRVRVSRGDDEERHFRIEELLAVHWLELDEPPIRSE